MIPWALSIGLVVSLVGRQPETWIAFRDVAPESGLVFRFDNGTRGKHDLPEIMGGGVGLIDFDRDGDLDVYLCNGGPIAADPTRPDPPCRLFRNDGRWRFADVTESANAPGPSYAMGVAVGDYDGDARDDLFVSGWRDQRLYRNLGGGRFADVTSKAGLTSKLWSTSAAFADLDDDGDLDLYVCNYLDYDPETAPFCAAPDGKRDYCGPEGFDSQPDRLYRNNGDGTFHDASKEAGIVDRGGRGLGVLVADLVGDPRPDVYVANDGTPCRLYENRGGLKFADVAPRAGVAVDGSGNALAGMGVAAGDLDGDGRVDLLASNFLGRTTVGFLSRGDGLFEDASAALGLTTATRPVLGFGLGLADFDGDGDVDLLQANGHVLDRSRLGTPFAMKATLLRNDGGRLKTPPGAGPFFDREMLGRGVAIGDLDGDGRLDAVVAAIDGPAAVLRNETASEQVALFEIVTAKGCPAIGAKVRIELDARSIVQPVVGGGSYLSAPDRRVALGVGQVARVKELDVVWPSGRVERFSSRSSAGVMRLVEGRGR